MGRTEAPVLLDLPPSWLAIVGKRFGRLTALGYAGAVSPRGEKKVACYCDCGCYTDAMPNSLTSGNTKSCGCLRREKMAMVGASTATHGAARGGRVTVLYRVWQAMRRRCLDPNNSAYKDYGGRGIAICSPWAESFEKFRDDVLATIGDRRDRSYSFDRIDNDGNYEPGNVRWATPKEQARNQRSNVLYEFRGERLTLAELAERHGMSYELVLQRVARFKWSLEDALTMPAGGGGGYNWVAKDERKRLCAVWYAMVSRCHDSEDDRYADYGGRGIEVCDRWRTSFDDFFSDVGPRPSKQHTLDRIDNSRGYSPDNVRWATARQQTSNRRNTVTCDLGGVTRPLSEWAEMAGLRRGLVGRRLRQGWTLEEALGTPTGFGRCAKSDRKKWTPPA